MKPSSKCYELIMSMEGCKLKAYLCPADVPTIGYGSILYPTGVKVKLGDVITQQIADELLAWEVNEKAKGVAATKINVTQNQFDALVSFAYNVGLFGFRKSTMLKKIKANPNDPTIRFEFLRWVNKGSDFEKGLTIRRTAEANLYFKK